MISVDEKVPGGMRHRFQARTHRAVATWLVQNGLYPVIAVLPGETLSITGQGWTVENFTVNRLVERALPDVVHNKRALLTAQLLRVYASRGQASDQVPRVQDVWDAVALQEAAADWPKSLKIARPCAGPCPPPSVFTKPIRRS